ncbi:MAG: hypothetical protein HFI32_07770 [Lachnospiraceae bacterium]|nr:hypothetical protein [Lachnospiraceae bacterium]
MILVVFIAFLYGCATVISKMINYRATQELGTWNGSLVNYVVASLLALVMLLAATSFRPDLHVFQDAPFYLYAGGAFGVIAFVLSLVCLSRMKVFQSTILLLVGQLLAGILFDVIVFQNFTPLKAAGILLVTVGIFWDKRITTAKSEALEAPKEQSA